MSKLHNLKKKFYETVAEETSDTGSDASSGRGIALEYIANTSVECHTDPYFEEFPQGVCSLVYRLWPVSML